MAGARERARAELTAEILDTARRQMAAEGAAALSLRAVAREIGMVSSAMYRYFPSRDHLLTALIVDAYDSLGALAEETDAACDRDDLHGRWSAIGWATYRWAVDNPSRYSLLFGTPVPGYRAPDDTIGPATRFTAVLVRLLDDASRAGVRPVVDPVVPVTVGLDLERLRQLTGSTMDDPMFVAGMQAWTALFGLISFVLFGQFQNVVGDLDGLARSVIDTLGQQVLGQQVLVRPTAKSVRSGTTTRRRVVKGT